MRRLMRRGRTAVPLELFKLRDCTLSHAYRVDHHMREKFFLRCPGFETRDVNYAMLREAFSCSAKRL